MGEKKKGECSSEADYELDKTQGWVSLEKREGVAKPPNQMRAAGEWSYTWSLLGENIHTHTER